MGDDLLPKEIKNKKTEQKEKQDATKKENKEEARDTKKVNLFTFFLFGVVILGGAILWREFIGEWMVNRFIKGIESKEILLIYADIFYPICVFIIYYLFVRIFKTQGQAPAIFFICLLFLIADVTNLYVAKHHENATSNAQASVNQKPRVIKPVDYIVYPRGEHTISLKAGQITEKWITVPSGTRISGIGSKDNKFKILYPNGDILNAWEIKKLPNRYKFKFQAVTDQNLVLKVK